MAVYELNKGQLLRVARSIDGKLQQEYFSLIGLNRSQQAGVRKKAKALDKKWADKQKSAKNKRVRDAGTDKKHSTGVRGINLVHRPSPAFRVQVQTRGKSHVREFSVKRLGAAKAWAEATKFLAECRGYKSAPKAWKDRMPRVSAKSAKAKAKTRAKTKAKAKKRTATKRKVTRKAPKRKVAKKTARRRTTRRR